MFLDGGRRLFYPKQEKNMKNQLKHSKGVYGEMKVTPEGLTAWWLNYSHRIWESAVTD